MEHSLHTDDDFNNLLNQIDAGPNFVREARLIQTDVRGRNGNLNTTLHNVGRTVRPILGAWVHRLLTGQNFVSAANPHAMNSVPNNVAGNVYTPLNPPIVGLGAVNSRAVVRFVRDSVEETELAVGASDSAFLFEYGAHTYVVKITITIQQDLQTDVDVRIRVFNQQLDYANGINNLINQLAILGF